MIDLVDQFKARKQILLNRMQGHKPTDSIRCVKCNGTAQHTKIFDYYKENKPKEVYTCTSCGYVIKIQ